MFKIIDARNALYTAGISLLLLLIHYISVKLYSIYCIPNTLLDWVLYPYTVTTPFCRVLSYTQGYSYDFYVSILFSKITIIQGFMLLMKQRYVGNDNKVETK